LKIPKGGNQNPYIEEEQTTQWPKEKVQKYNQRSTKHTYKTKDQMRANFQPQCCSLYLVEKQEFDQISFGLRKDIKGVIRRRYSKGNRQYNGQMKKTTNGRQNTTQKNHRLRNQNSR
jgi:hypothetical protein